MNRAAPPRVVLAATLLAALATAATGGPDDSVPVPIARIDEIRLAHPIPPGESLTTLELLRGQNTSAHLVQVRTRLRPQIHRDHEEVAAILDGRGVKTVRSLVGSYVTSLEMAGCSLTVSVLDGELTKLWDSPIHTAALRWGV